jgi:DNA polymerase III sliding clamp (beta) subunit (PCNA family)
MRVICSQERLGPTLQAISRVTKKSVFPLYQSVLFTATRPAYPTEQGTLTMLGAGRYGEVGLMAQIPATVEEEGQVLVPIEPLTEYVTTLHPGLLTLSQKYRKMEKGGEQAQPSWRTAERDAPTMTLPLHIESTTKSAAGAISRHHARLATWQEENHDLFLPFQLLLTASTPMATIRTTSFKEALTCCTPFAHTESKETGAAPEMNGVLFRGDAQTLELIATTGTRLVAYQVPLTQAEGRSFAGLFNGTALSWIKDTLPDGLMTLSLVWDEHTHQPVLFLSAEQMIWFCRSLNAPFPRSWTTILHCAHEAELRIRRQELARALTCFAGSAARYYQALALQVEGTTLWMCPFGVQGTLFQEQREIQLVSASGDLRILINPRQFKRLLHYARGEILSIQIGHFERKTGQACKDIGFLRIPTERTTVMMSLNHTEPVLTSSPSSKAMPVSDDAEHALASINVVD